MPKSLALMTVAIAVLLLAAGCRNKPPLVPTRPDGPDSVALNVEATYTSRTTDPNRDAVRYVFEWADDNLDTSDYLPSGEAVTMSHTWTAVGVYPIRVKAQDERGLWSADWSEPLNVTVYLDGENNPPGPPDRPEGPDSTDVDVWVRFTSRAVDPDGDSVQLRFDWGNGDTSQWSAFVPGGTDVSDSVRYDSPGRRMVRAVARDNSGAVSSWSEPATILVYGENDPPGPPVLTGPDRGIANGPMYLIYASARDPQGDDVEYRFFWGDGRISEWTEAAPEGLPVPDSTRYAAEGSYSIRAVARDVFGAVSDTSEPLTFEVVGEGSILWAVSTDACVASPAWTRVQKPDGTLRWAVAIGNTEGRIIAVDAWQGTILYDNGILAAEEFNSSPSVSEDWSTLYMGAAVGRLFAFNNLGMEKWVWPDTADNEDLGATPVVDGQYVYCAGEAGVVHKLRDAGDKAEPEWSFRTREAIYSSPVLVGDRLIVCDDSGYVYFLNAGDGSLAHEFLADGGIVSSPAVDIARRRLYVGTDQGTMYAVSPTGTELWAYSTAPFEIIGAPVIARDGGVVFGADNGVLYKLNPENGQLMAGWPVELTVAGIAATPAVCADGVIYVVSDEDMLYAVREDGGLHWPEPVVLPLPEPRLLSVEELAPSITVDQYGIIYVASGTDGLFAVAGRGAAGRLATTDWPMFQRDIRHSGKTGSW